MQIDQHLEDGMILKRLKRHRMALRLSKQFLLCGLTGVAWLIFLLPVEYYTPYAGVEWRYARFSLAIAIVMIVLGYIGRTLAGPRVDVLLPLLIEGCCADCGYTLGRSVFDGQCPECGALLMQSKQRRRWLAVHEKRKINRPVGSPSSSRRCQS